jgi:hypothetical protein
MKLKSGRKHVPKPKQPPERLRDPSDQILGHRLDNHEKGNCAYITSRGCLNQKYRDYQII